MTANTKESCPVEVFCKGFTRTGGLEWLRGRDCKVIRSYLTNMAQLISNLMLPTSNITEPPSPKFYHTAVVIGIRRCISSNYPQNVLSLYWYVTLSHRVQSWSKNSKHSQNTCMLFLCSRTFSNWVDSVPFLISQKLWQKHFNITAVGDGGT